MRKAYRVTGSTFTKPENLPEGLTVKERLVGDTLTVDGFRGGEYTFVEVKDGSIVLFKAGESNSQLHFCAEDIEKIFRFFGDVAAEHATACNHGQKVRSKCPGTPHSGHSASDWSCWMDR